MLVDTDVLIWYLRGYPSAAKRIDRLNTLIISAVTYLELLQGMRNRVEMNALRKSLAGRQAEQLPLTPAITERAITLMENLTLSHGMQMGDALIAATALEHHHAVLTGNVKHFSAVQDLQIDRFEP